MFVNFRSAVLSSDAKRPKSSAFKKKLKDQTRPYTPIYSTLLNKEETISIDRQSIIRQLCVLLWIMESVSLEKASAPPLNNCFNLKYIYLNFDFVRLISLIYYSWYRNLFTEKTVIYTEKIDQEAIEKKWNAFCRMKIDKNDKVYIYFDIFKH